MPVKEQLPFQPCLTMRVWILMYKCICDVELPRCLLTRMEESNILLSHHRSSKQQRKIECYAGSDDIVFLKMTAKS